MTRVRISVKSRLQRLLPADTASYPGPRWAAWVLLGSNVVGTVRSLIHVFAPDSGAGTIASFPTGGPGGQNTIDLLAQWGGAQLLEAAIIWIVLVRYRGLIPLMLGVVTAEQVLRLYVGQVKPIVSAHTPPGALSWVWVVIAGAAFVASLSNRTVRARRDSNPQPSDP